MATGPRIARNPTVDGPLPSPKGYQQLDTATLAASSGLTVPAGTTMVVLQAETAAVRWRADGTAPTASVGMLINVDGELVYPASKEDIEALRFIRSAPGAILNASFY